MLQFEVDLQVWLWN